MSYILRAKRVAYDNIAVGSATGLERTKGTMSTEGFYERMITSASGVSTEPTTVNDATRDRIITSAGGVTTLTPRETIINTN